MNALTRFYQRGAADADRRIAKTLLPPATAETDRYLMSSMLVRGFDRFTRVLQSSTASSQAGSAISTAREAWRRSAWPERYQTIALVLIVATGVHVAAMLMGGQPFGWYRILVPALVTVFAALLLMASRTTHAQR